MVPTQLNKNFGLLKKYLISKVSLKKLEST